MAPAAKDDVVWFGFIALVTVILVFVFVLSIVFVVKTSYSPPITDNDRRTKRRRRKHKKKHAASEDYVPPETKEPNNKTFEVSQLGSLSESNSEETDDENSLAVDSKTDPQHVSIEMVNVEPNKSKAEYKPDKKVEMNIPFELVTRGRRIGKGGVGSVYAGEYEGVGPVALKKVSVVGKNRTGMEERLENLAQEARVMASLRHPHIVYLYGLTIEPPEESINGHVDRCAYLVMELCSGDVGSLIDNSPKLVQNKGSSADDAHGSPPAPAHDVFYADRMAIMQKIAQQVASTMEFVHQQNVVHRDLKPANILLKENNDIRIADFGLSKSLSKEQNHQTMEIGTPAYMAPELTVGFVDGDPQTTEAKITMPKKLDVYAFGILLWSLYMDLHPYPNLGAFQTIYKVKMENIRPELPPTTSVAMRKLLEQCWALEAQDRPSFQEINLSLSAIIANGDWVSQDGGAKIFVD